MSTPAIPEHDGPHPRRAIVAWLGFTGLLTFLAFALNGSAETSGDEPLVYSYRLTSSAITLDIILISVAVGIAYLYWDRDLWNTFGFRSFTWRDLRLAGVVTVASLVVAAVLEQFLHAGDEQGITASTWDATRVTPFVINAILIVALAPFAEELLFRGVGVQVLSVLGAPVAIIVTGVMFGLIHGILAALPPLIIFGVGLAYIRWRTQSVFPAMIAHGTFNGIGLAVSFIGT